MSLPPRPPFPRELDELASAPLAVKDALRGLRRKLSDAPTAIEVLPSERVSLSPLALAARLIRETRKIASLGEDIARDVLLHQRDEARLKVFAASGFTTFTGEREELFRHDFVASRYAAGKRVLARFGYPDALLFEQPIDVSWRALRPRYRSTSKPVNGGEGFDYSLIAATALSLAKSGALAEQSKAPSEPTLAQLTFVTLGLAEAVLAHTPQPALETIIAALELSADVISLRKSTISAIVNGFDPEAQLAAEYRLLAPPLAES